MHGRDDWVSQEPEWTIGAICTCKPLEFGMARLHLLYVARQINNKKNGSSSSNSSKFLSCVPALLSLSDVVLLDGLHRRFGFVAYWKRVALYRQAIPKLGGRPSYPSACALESRFAAASSRFCRLPFPLPLIHTFPFFNCVLAVFVRQRPEHNGALCNKVHGRMQKKNA